MRAPMNPYPTSAMFSCLFFILKEASSGISRRPSVSASRITPGRQRIIVAVRIFHGDHRGEHVAPGLRIHHRGVWKHATVPADVLERARRLARLIAHPRAGDADDVHLPVGIPGRQWRPSCRGPRSLDRRSFCAT